MRKTRLDEDRGVAMGRAARRAIDGLLQLYCIRVYTFPDLVAAREARREKREEITNKGRQETPI